MSVLNVILLILVCSLMTTLCILIACVKKYFLINQDLSKMINERYEAINQLEINEKAYEELTNAYILKDVAHSIVLMLLNLAYNNEEKYSFYFNSLYFFGVPKENLENMEQIMIFHNNCLNNKYNLVEGEKPFKYQFILKGENDEENNN